MLSPIAMVWREKALAFDGVSQYVEVPGGGGLSGALGGTVSMWVNWSGFQDADCCGSYGAVLSRQSNGVFSDNIVALEFDDPASSGVVWRQANCCGAPLITSADPVGDDQWRHIAVTFGPFGSELFLDGVSQGTAVGPAPLHRNADVPLSIGAWSGDGGGFSTSSIDDVAIFNDLLSAQQVAALASQTATPLTVGPGTPPFVSPPPPGSIVAKIHEVSSNLGDVTPFNRLAEYVVNRYGWVDSTHSINPESTMWLNNGTFVEPNDLEPFITFDLGQVSALENVKVWNYNESLADRPELLGRGVAAANILVAGDDLKFTTLIANQEFDIAPGDDTVDFGQVIALGGVQARYVKFEILGNHGGDADFVGLSEVMFFGSSGSLKGDFNGNGVLDAADIDQLTVASAAGTNNPKYDLNADSAVNETDVTIWAKDLKKTWIGDADVNGAFDSSDFVKVFTVGKYEQDQAAAWTEGDWNGSGRFDSSDFVAAFVDGGYELGAGAEVQAIPEPSSLVLLVLGVLGVMRAVFRRVGE